MNNKRTLVDFNKDIVLVTRLRIFCTALFTNNNIKVVIQIDAFLAHHFWYTKIKKFRFKKSNKKTGRKNVNKRISKPFVNKPN